jgi:hypothetical protein
MRTVHLLWLLIAFVLGILGVAKASIPRDGEYGLKWWKGLFKQQRKSSTLPENAGLSDEARLFFSPDDDLDRYFYLGGWSSVK